MKARVAQELDRVVGPTGCSDMVELYRARDARRCTRYRQAPFLTFARSCRKERGQHDDCGATQLGELRRTEHRALREVDCFTSSRSRYAEPWLAENAAVGPVRGRELVAKSRTLSF